MPRLVSLLNRFEPSFHDTEDDYRQHYLQADLAQAKVVCLVQIVAAFVFIPSDYVLFQSGGMFFALLATRLAFAIATLYFAGNLSRISRPEIYDRLTFIWTIAALVFSIGIDSSRPPDYVGRFMLHLTYVFLIYLALPNVLIFRTTSAVLFSFFSIASLFSLKTESATLFAIATIFALLIANLVGFVISIRIYTYRRHQFNAIKEANQLNAKLTVLAETDSLTGILNRRKLFEFGAEEFTRFLRYRRPFSVALMDLDFFKRVNDCHGHDVGDQVLVIFANLVMSEKRETDKFGRLGGEEFVLLLPETPDDTAFHIGERIRWRLEKTDSISVLIGYPMTASLGIVVATPADTNFDALLRRADEAMYRAKHNGRNRVEI